MIITWLGQNCFKIEGKTGTVLVDPFEAKTGQRMPKVATDILVLPRPLPEKERKFLKTESFVVEAPGEYESNQIFVEGKAVGKKGETVFRLNIDGVNLGHLGNQSQPEEIAEELLDGVDILFVPVGGGGVLGPREASEVVNKIEPRIVIPMHYRQPGLKTLEPVEKFSKEMGRTNNLNYTKKFSITRKDLPHEETNLVIFEA